MMHNVSVYRATTSGGDWYATCSCGRSKRGHTKEEVVADRVATGCMEDFEDAYRPPPSGRTDR